MKIQTFIKNNLWLVALDLLLIFGFLKWSFEYWKHGQITDNRHGFIFQDWAALLLLTGLFLLLLYLSHTLLRRYALWKSK